MDLKICALVVCAIILCNSNNVLGQSSANINNSPDNAGANGTQQQIKCNKKTYKDVDAMIARMLTFGNSGRKFPEEAKEVNKYCE